MESYGVTKVITSHPEGNINVCMKCNYNPSNISLKTTKVNLMVAIQVKS